ncbi:MAG: SDR family oxidoreductase [Gammaproteobacteria bacterium]|nr:SDR family oxidoreductase [Gammaproteobacteria bacterium]
MGRLAGKVAIITGAGSGQGRAAAILFAREGARVVISDVDEAGGAATLASVHDARGEGLFHRADVSSASDVQALIQATSDRFEGIDILYNNAAVWSGNQKDNHVTDLSEENWDDILGVNLKGIFLVSKYGIPALIARGGGSVINTSSIAGIRGSRNRSHAYSASKGGVISLTRAMAVTYARNQVRVNAICPGGVDTPMIATMMDTEQRAERFAASHPLGRMGQPDDIAHCALYLASDESAWVTGTVIPIDGGYSA